MLPSLHRLKERPDFTHCYTSGRRYFSQNFVLFAVSRGGVSHPWRFGTAITKKTGTAVWRNRLRRLLRESIRLAQSTIPWGYDYVVVPKKHLDPRKLTFATVNQEILPLFTNIRRQGGA